MTTEKKTEDMTTETGQFRFVLKLRGEIIKIDDGEWLASTERVGRHSIQEPGEGEDGATKHMTGPRIGFWFGDGKMRVAATNWPRYTDRNGRSNFAQTADQNDLPEANISTSRDIAAIAKDIVRRVIHPYRAIWEEAEERGRGWAAHDAEIRQHAETLRAELAGCDIAKTGDVAVVIAYPKKDTAHDWETVRVEVRGTGYCQIEIHGVDHELAATILRSLPRE